MTEEQRYAEFVATQVTWLENFRDSQNEVEVIEIDGSIGGRKVA